VQLDRPAAARADLADVAAQRAAGDDREGRRVGGGGGELAGGGPRGMRGTAAARRKRRLSGCGGGARETAPPPLRPAPPASAPARSRTESRAILAPSPATLPALTTRSTGSRGTRPSRIALAGDR